MSAGDGGELDSEVIISGCNDCGCQPSIFRFYDALKDRQWVIQFIKDHGLIARGKNCPKCKSECTLDTINLNWRCQKVNSRNKKRKVRCNTKRNAFLGTFFYNSKLPIEKILLFTYLFMDKSFSIALVKREVEICGKTIVDWSSFCREVCIDFSVKCGAQKIGGIKITVEIDESKFGKTKKVKGHKGRWNQGQWVFGGICRETNEFFMVPVENRKQSTLLKIIKERIRPGTTIISDCWKSYDCLKNKGFTHLQVNHSLTFKDPITGAHTNKVTYKG